MGFTAAHSWHVPTLCMPAWPLTTDLAAAVQVRCLLASANPTPVVLHSTPEVGDVEVQALQQAKLLALSFRTMALPLGRGALTLGECKWRHAWPGARPAAAPCQACTCT